VLQFTVLRKLAVQNTKFCLLSLALFTVALTHDAFLDRLDLKSELLGMEPAQPEASLYRDEPVLVPFESA
jgi:hypothetical protein